MLAPTTLVVLLLSLGCVTRSTGVAVTAVIVINKLITDLTLLASCTLTRLLFLTKQISASLNRRKFKVVGCSKEERQTYDSVRVNTNLFGLLDELNALLLETAFSVKAKGFSLSLQFCLLLALSLTFLFLVEQRSNVRLLNEHMVLIARLILTWRCRKTRSCSSRDLALSRWYLA